MHIATAEEMRRIDREAIEGYGIPGACLMQSAGEALARACVEALGGSVRTRRVALLCGKGNNGGDGFVAARHLANAGAETQILLAGDPADLKGDAALHFAPLGPLGVPTRADAAFDDLARYDLLVDCLLGTGARGAPTGRIADAIAAANRAGVPVLACDLPSGVDADTGKVAGEAIRAVGTLTFHRLKPGLLLYPGAERAGRVEVAPIGIPEALGRDTPLFLATAETVRAALPPRAQGRDVNKGTFGRLLIVAGAAGMAGAAALAALAALRTGAGLVYLAVPEGLLATAAVLAPEVVLRPLPQTPEGTHGGSDALEALRALTETVDAVALGPGLTAHPRVVDFVEAFVRSATRPLVVDADGLNALAGKAIRFEAPAVLTPHPGEMGRLLGRTAAEVQGDRLAAVRACAARYGAATLLKGARTLIATPEGQVGFGRLGAVALATAGSGDVLTGAIGALLAGGMPATEAAIAGSYLHALAGEIVQERIGPAGVLAREIAAALPEARRRLEAAQGRDL